MNKKALFAAFIVLMLTITSGLISCAAPVSSTSSQPTLTVMSTVTEPAVTVTNTATQTVTATATQTVTSTPAANSPETPQFADKNNGHFLVGQVISGYNKTVNVSGAVTETPIYEDAFLDLHLEGFYTQQNAFFEPGIPTITDEDEWILKFVVPERNLPAVVNWAYITKSGTPDKTLAFSIWPSDTFKKMYLTDRDTLVTLKGPTSDLYVSADGTHVQNIAKAYEYVAFIRTRNLADFQGWWLKVGEAELK